MYTTDDLSITLPLTLATRQTAQQFAQEQPTPEKAIQVELNTLAVLTVKDCLEMLGIPTDIHHSDSWNPVIRVCADVADLMIPDIGQLECRPIAVEASSCQIPLEVLENRIGYVLVAIDLGEKQGKILGFTPIANPIITRDQLEPIEALIPRLFPSAISTPETDSIPTRLSQWFNQIIDASWQQVETLLTPNQTDLAFNFRSVSVSPETENDVIPMIRRGRLIDLGMQVAGHPLALIMELRPESTSEIGIRFQVHPTGTPSYLPPHLKLMVLDETGTSLKEVQAREADNYIQVKITGQLGEYFSIKISLGDATITEKFMI